MYTEIELILDRAQLLFRTLGWQWAQARSRDSVPSRREMKQFLDRAFRGVADGGDSRGTRAHGSGRFLVQRFGTSVIVSIELAELELDDVVDWLGDREFS